MSYRDNKSGEEQSGFGKKLLGIGAFLLAAIFAKALVSGGIDFARQKTTTTASVERELVSDPIFGTYLIPLKEHFPIDYDMRMSRFAEMARAGASQQEISAFAFNSSRRFVEEHISEISSAPTETLVEIGEAHADLAEALAATSTVACAQWGFEGFQADTAGNLNKSLASKFLEPARLMIVAAHQGRTAKVQRGAELSDGDVTALLESLESQGLSDEQIEALFSGNGQAANINDRCKMTVALYRGIAELPPESSARVTAAIALSTPE